MDGPLIDFTSPSTGALMPVGAVPLYSGIGRPQHVMDGVFLLGQGESNPFDIVAYQSVSNSASRNDPFELVSRESFNYNRASSGRTPLPLDKSDQETEKSRLLCLVDDKPSAANKSGEITRRSTMNFDLDDIAPPELLGSSVLDISDYLDVSPFCLKDGSSRRLLGTRYFSTPTCIISDKHESHKFVPIAEACLSGRSDECSGLDVSSSAISIRDSSDMEIVDKLKESIQKRRSLMRRSNSLILDACVKDGFSRKFFAEFQTCSSDPPQVNPNSPSAEDPLNITLQASLNNISPSEGWESTSFSCYESSYDGTFLSSPPFAKEVICSSSMPIGEERKLFCYGDDNSLFQSLSKCDKGSLSALEKDNTDLNKKALSSELPLIVVTSACNTDNYISPIPLCEDAVRKLCLNSSGSRASARVSTQDEKKTLLDRSQGLSAKFNAGAPQTKLVLRKPAEQAKSMGSKGPMKATLPVQSMTRGASVGTVPRISSAVLPQRNQGTRIGVSPSPLRRTSLGKPNRGICLPPSPKPTPACGQRTLPMPRRILSASPKVLSVASTRLKTKTTSFSPSASSATSSCNGFTSPSRLRAPTSACAPDRRVEGGAIRKSSVPARQPSSFIGKGIPTSQRKSAFSSTTSPAPSPKSDGKRVLGDINGSKRVGKPAGSKPSQLVLPRGGHRLLSGKENHHE